MPTNAIDEHMILAELHQVPSTRWVEVLAFMRTLQPGHQTSTPPRPIVTGADLLGSPLAGIWADRTDITDSREFARQLRQQAERR